jgi:RNA polymerase sigma factor for flagellar operon FliA
MQCAEKMEERNDLIHEYRKFVTHVAAKLMRYMNLPKAMFDDLEAAGYLGLVEAAERYDKNSGHEFKKYAFYRIRGSIIDSVRSSNHLSGEAYRCAKALQAAQSLQEELRYIDKEPTIKPKTLEDTKLRLSKLLDLAAKGVLSFKMSLCEVKQEVEEIPDENSNTEDIFIKRQNISELHEILETLPELERLIVQEYYFKGKTFLEIGEENGGMSKSWVCRLHARALEQIKNTYLQKMAS